MNSKEVKVKSKSNKPRGKQNKTLLIVSICVSAILLLTFMILQAYDLKSLNLDVKWVIVCGIPILLALFIGGYIKTFKGFGVELEADLNEPLPRNLISETDMMPSPAIAKSSINTLNEMQASEKRKINRLSFVYGRKDFYDEYAVVEYIRILEKLRFIEITDDDGLFLYLLPIGNVLRYSNGRVEVNVQDSLIFELIRSIENENIELQYPKLVSQFVSTSDSTIAAYKKVKLSSQNKVISQREEALPVVDKNGRMIGIIYLNRIEANIAAEVAKNF